jgi:hypothetical protein
MTFPTDAELQRRRTLYVGKRIRLIRMKDETSMAPGLEGVVDHVDDGGTLHMHWDNNRSLGLIVGVDEFEVLPTLAAI